MLLSRLDCRIVGIDDSHGTFERRAAKWQAWLYRSWPDADPRARHNGFVYDALVIFLAWALVSARFLSGRLAIPWDSAAAFFPQTRFVVDTIRSGQAPWWNPYLYGGQPALGDPQSMIFTPQVLVGLIAGAHFDQYAFDMTSLMTVLIGGIALARYTRAYSDNRTLPILGALVFIAGGVATSRLQHVPQIASYGLLPLQLLALRAVCLRPTIIRTALLVLVLVAGALNPNQVTFLSAFALLPFAVLHLYESRHRIGALLSLAAAAVIVVIAVSPVLSAILEFVAISNRPEVDIGEAYGKSFPLMNIASVVLPGLYGVMTPQNGTWPPTDLTQDFLYIGLIPSVIFLSSLFFLRGASLIVALCWCGVVVSFIFAMGVNTHLFPFLFHHVPGFAAFRRPADGAYFVNLFLALLIGSSRVPDRARFGPWPVAALVAIIVVVVAVVALKDVMDYALQRGHFGDLLLLFAAFGIRLALLAGVSFLLIRLNRRAVRWVVAPLVIGLTILDLAHAGRARSVFGIDVRGSAVGQAYSGVLSWTVPKNAIEETITFLQTHGAAGDSPSWRMEALGGDLGSDMPMAFKIMMTQGYDPLRLQTYDHAIGGQYLQVEIKQFTSESPNYNSPDYRRLGLRYVLIQSYIAQHSDGFGAFGAEVAKIRTELMASDWARRLDAPGDYEIWELRGAMPRAMVVAANGTEQPCHMVSYGTVRVIIQCFADGPGRLVLGDNYSPGWDACVNGQPVQVEPFRSIFRSVAVPQGDSVVDFRYHAVPFLRNATSCPVP